MSLIFKDNQLNSLLISYNLFGMADVPTRIQNNSLSAMDNILINYFTYLLHGAESFLSSWLACS